MSSNEKPFVSVCIPVRNGAAVLPHTLTNLIERTTYPHERFEILLGDHGSTDGTRALVARWVEQFPKLKIVSVPFTGPNRSLVRNSLLRQSTGQIVIFIDHDILTPPSFIGEHVSLHQAHPGSLVAGLTYGKGVFRQEIDEFVGTLHLNDIGRSLPELETNPAMWDFRVGPGMFDQPQRLHDASSQLAPHRFFWTCNLSARREDIDSCGQFDEAFTSWGVEDDDFAYGFRVQGKQLLFTRDAWAFHVPHAADTWRNLLSWRNNLGYMFRKFPTRELECYSVFAKEIAAGKRRMEGWLALLAGVDLSASIERAEKALPPRSGRRAAHFVNGGDGAKRLQLSDALAPFGSFTEGMHESDGVRFWPQFGFATAFEAREIDEVVLFVDLLLLIDRFQLTLLLAESARFSRRAILVYGPRSGQPEFELGRAVFEEALATVHFESISSVRWD